jgi:hypothetical protein
VPAALVFGDGRLLDHEEQRIAWNIGIFSLDTSLQIIYFNKLKL